MITILAAIVNMDSGVIVSCPPAAWIVFMPSKRLVNTLGFAPQIRRAEFCRKYDTPIAVISTARDPVPLSGLYASLSMMIPRSVQATIATSRASQPFIPTYIVSMNET